MTPQQKRLLRFKSPAPPTSLDNSPRKSPSARGLSFDDAENDIASPNVESLCSAFASSARVSGNSRAKRVAMSSPYAGAGATPHRAAPKRSSLRATPAAFTTAAAAEAVAPAIETPLDTAVFSPDDCLDHGSFQHQESPARITAIRAALSGSEFDALRWSSNQTAAPITDVLRVHDLAYVEHVRTACALSTATATTGKLDVDTLMTSGSLRAALVAAGAACAAVDAVMRGESRTALCVVRPPGHHVGRSGAVAAPNFSVRPEMCSNGFGVLNTIAIAAAHARGYWGRSGALQRVAIVDFDIHHGNGTEDIVRNLTPREVALPLPSSWAPRTERVYKPWLDETDAENVFFGSVHLFDGAAFYPCSGAGGEGDASSSSGSGSNTSNIVNIPMPIVGTINPAQRRKARFAKGKRSVAALHAQASAAYRERVLSHLIPRLDAFRPELILISAGFDGHCDDHYYYLGDEDYAWFTEQIVGVAARWGEGRVVSILEGGYATSEVKKKPVARAKSARGRAAAAAAPALAATKMQSGHGTRGAVRAAFLSASSESSSASDSDSTPQKVEESDANSSPLGRAVAAHVRALMEPAKTADVAQV